MGVVSADHINPFLLSAAQIIKQVCNLDIKIGKLIKDNLTVKGEPLFIILGITGEITGQVSLVMEISVAREIASKMMMGAPVNEIDDMAKSALSELGNMIMGNAATIFYNKEIHIDITPPTLGIGAVEMESPQATVFMVPLLYDGGEIDLNFLLKLA